MRTFHSSVAVLLMVACRGGESRPSADTGSPRDTASAATASAATPTISASSDWLIAADPADDAVHASDTEASLRARYGADNVSPTRVEIGEGESVAGSALFPRDPRRRLYVEWGDTIARARAVRVRVAGDSSRWRVVPGVALGTRLSELERLNGRSFSLLGFEFDYAGTVDSWQGGRLDSLWRPAPGNSHLVWLRLRPDRTADAALESSVVGDRVFSSAHPAMRTLDPRVYDLFVEPR